jgi:hypothetical protein
VHPADGRREPAQPFVRVGQPEGRRNPDERTDGTDAEGDQHRQAGTLERLQSDVQQQQEDRDRGADSDQVLVERGRVRDRRDQPDVCQQDSEEQRDDRATEPAARREPAQPVRDRRHGAEDGQQVN